MYVISDAHLSSQLSSSIRPTPGPRHQFPAKDSLHPCYKRFVPTRPARYRTVPYEINCRVISVFKIRSPVVHPIPHRSIIGEYWIILPQNMACRARPAILLSSFDQSNPDRVIFNVANARIKVPLIKNARKKPPLP